MRRGGDRSQVESVRLGHHGPKLGLGSVGGVRPGMKRSCKRKVTRFGD